jgi:hypothetical protein
MKDYWTDQLKDAPKEGIAALVAAALLSPFITTLLGFGVLKLASAFSPSLQASAGSYTIYPMLPGVLIGPLLMWASDFRWSGLVAIGYGLALVPVLFMFSLLLACMVFGLCL